MRVSNRIILPSDLLARVHADRLEAVDAGILGRRYMSNATCLMWPHLFYACFVVSWITIICHNICHV